MQVELSLGSPNIAWALALSLAAIVGMTGQAGSRRRFRRVPALGRPGVAVHTTQILVNAVRQASRDLP